MSNTALISLIRDTPDCEFLARLEKHWHIFEEMYEACGRRHDPPCGSYLFDGKTVSYCPLMYAKQKLLYEYAKRSQSALEIGIYMGHSILIMLLANPTLHITGIDISDTFAGPSIEVLRKYFPLASIEFIHGDSQIALPMVTRKYDLFHIDGMHNEEYAVKDFAECVKKMDKRRNCAFVFDDYDVYPQVIHSIIQTPVDGYSVAKAFAPECPWRNAVLEYVRN